MGTMPAAGKRPSGPAPTMAGPGMHNLQGLQAKTPTYDYGRGPSASYPVNPMPAATSVYGQPAGSVGNPAAAYAQTAPAPMAPASHAGATRTSMFQVPAAAWQPALPVSPWSTQERSSIMGGSVDTETILRSDLKALRRSRFRGWMWFTLLLFATGGLGYLGVKERLDHVRDKEALARTKIALGNLEQMHRQTLANLGVSESAATAAAAAAAKGKPAGAVAPAAMGAGPTSARTAKLNEDLKKQLAGVPGLSVDTRGDRVVVAIEMGALFDGNELEVGLSGYRVLYKFGKVLRTIKDRNIVVSVPSMESRRGKGWNVAAARSVSLGRFLVDDISVEPHRVIARAPAPTARAARADRIEFSLESRPETTKS